MAKHVLRLDYETFGEKEADLPTKGLDIYSAHPATRVLMAQYQIDDGPITPWEAHRGPVPAELREALLDPSFERWCFNAQFERVMTRRVLKIKTPYEGWRCTMSLAYLQCFKGTLEDVGEQMGLGDEVKKNPEGKRLIRLFSMPQTVTKNQPHRIRDWRTDPEDWQKFLDYCRQDVVAETAIWNRLIRFPVPDSEWELYELDQRINDRGKPVDMAFVNHAIAMADRRQKELVDRLREVTGLANPNSVAQLLPWLQARGYPFPDLNKDTVEKVYRENVNEKTREILPNSVIDQECANVMALRKWAARLSVKKYNTLRDTTGRGDRARFLFQFAGASRTARWAGRRVQSHNLPRTPKNIEPEEDKATGEVDDSKLRATTEMIRDGDYDALDLMFDEPMEALVGCVRSAFGVKPGKRMISADLASIEACVVAWLFDVPKMLEVIRAGRDIYKDFGTYLFRKPYDQITKAERNICKPPTLGAPYRLGGGDLRNGRKTGLWGYAENMGVAMTREQSHNAVKVFREVYAPEVVEAWYDLERGVKRAMTSGGPVKVGKLTFERIKPYMTLVLPSGRRIFYFQPRIETKTFTTGKMIETWVNGVLVKEEEETYTREVFTYMGQNQDTGKWERLENHGGRFVEQSVQATAREILVAQMRKAHDDGFHLVAHIHDEAVAEHDVGDNYHTLDRFIEHMRSPIPWAPGLPLGAAGWEGAFYRK